MRNLLIVVLLTCGGCAALAPSEAKHAAAVLHEDIEMLRPILAAVSTNAKLIRTLDAVAANVSALDALLNR